MKKSSSTQSVVKKTTLKKPGAVTTKKVTKPASVKKSPAARKAKKPTAGKVPVVAPPEQHFWVNDGRVIGNLRELADTFAAMDALVFAHHVNEVKNDFADWVEQVLCDEACARAIREEATTPKKAHTVVKRHLRFYLV